MHVACNARPFPDRRLMLRLVLRALQDLVVFAQQHHLIHRTMFQLFKQFLLLAPQCINHILLFLQF